MQRSPHQLTGQSQTFCSRACKHLTGRLTFKCYHCGVAVTRARWEVKNEDKAYCSRECTSASRAADPAWQEHARQMQSAHVRNKAPTKPELALYQILTDLLGADGFERQPRIHGRHPDAAVPALRLALQADGDYWHGPDAPEGNKRADASFNELFIREGWHVVRLREKTLTREPDVARALIAGVIAECRADESYALRQ